MSNVGHPFWQNGFFVARQKALNIRPALVHLKVFSFVKGAVHSSSSQSGKKLFETFSQIGFICLPPLGTS